MWQEPAAALASPAFSLSARPSSDPACKQAQGSCCAPSSCFAPRWQPLVLCCGALGARTCQAGSPWARHLRSIAPTPPGARVPPRRCVRCLSFPAGDRDERRLLKYSVATQRSKHS